MIEIKDTQTETPICPHCEKEQHSINCREIRAGFGVRYIYFCDSCKKVLGISHRKGFWMG
jgi:hypothetical protein